MRPVHFIGFKATGTDQFGKRYDCSFMISFPVQAQPHPQEVQQVVNRAVAQFQEFHPTGQIESKMEKTIVVSGVDTHA